MPKLARVALVATSLVLVLGVSASPAAAFTDAARAKAADACQRRERSILSLP